MDVEQRARELLRSEYMLSLSGAGPKQRHLYECAIRAIIAALTPPEGYVLVPIDVPKDAERYRWLRDNTGDEWDVTRWLDGEVQEIHVQDYLDEAIDGAMLAARPEVKP
ncbi:hypothetical protein [Stenotrophomonas maltophilia]|uniref:Uncharacterized protein n=1 Tax=Stenotrophomonas maltophilia TaxID=40324 RepID=A0AAJ2JC71_STEMA|nr:hypothetical protein [Stenotrophomonas maltophilia]MDT3468971.1 hypothetical protein [Stenotrophomonas maltophilia]